MYIWIFLCCFYKRNKYKRVCYKKTIVDIDGCTLMGDLYTQLRKKHIFNKTTKLKQ